MSWNLHFELEWRGGGPVPADLRRKAGRVLESCFKRTKNLGLTVLEPSEEELLRGSVQILFREGNDTDFTLLLGALQRLAREEPGLLVTASDEFYLKGEDVLEVGDPRALLSPDPTKGTGVFRTSSNATEHVYRAQLPQLDGRKVARSFLERLAARQLIEWGGPKDHAIEQLAVLVKQVENGRWRGADAVLRVLEEDPAVEEILATDRQLEDLWRQAVNQY